MRTIKELAVEAMAVQDACNLSGVLLGASRALADLRVVGDLRGDPQKHAIMMLWASKILHLAGHDVSCEPLEVVAYDVCRELAR